MRIEALSTVVAALESGKRPKGGASGESGTVPSLGGEHLNNDGGFRFDNLKYIDEQFFVGLKKGTIKTNDILIVKDGATTGKVSYVGSDFPFERAAINEHLFALTIDTKIANPRYVFSFLKSPQGQKEILKDFRGAAIGGISRGFVDLAKIPLSPLDDQIRIAHLLGKVEGLIAQRKQHLQQLDDLLKSVFLEMFGDPVRNEKGWETKALPELCTKITDGEHLNPQFAPSGMPMVMAGNVLDHTVNLRDTKFVEYGLGESFRKKCNPEPSDILLVSRGATIGRLCRVDTSEPFCLMGSVILLKPIYKIVSSTFLVAQLKHPALYWKLFRSSGSSAQQAIYLKDVKRLVCIHPPEELQLKFSDFSEKVESTKNSYRRSLTELETLYGALSQQAFKGDLDLSRVPMLSIQAEEKKTVAEEPSQISAEQGLTIHLPDTDNLLAALESTEARKNLLAQWLEAYRGQLGSTPFSVQSFMAAAQTRLAELHPESDFELGANDYEHIKGWVFEALADGRLQQSRDITGHDVSGEPIFGNLIEIKSGARP